MQQPSVSITPPAAAGNDNLKQWFAMKVFFNRIADVRSALQSRDIETWLATSPARGENHVRQLLPGILFARCTVSTLRDLMGELKGKVSVVTYPGSRLPAPIPDDQMSLFRLVVDNDPNFSLIGDDHPRWHVGQKVKVISGPLKDTVGHICRIRGDRRLVVSVSGVCAVATGYIPPRLLQPVD